ncbi:hypothetical protein HTZ97_05570 [Desulfuromonas acetoxidans]|nr:hypothetical protein [Desulfuromonas acetoxidans]NVE15927.1 hypothetical protein [Desulfuromonas acetoxidans]
MTFLALADQATDEGYCFPSVVTIAERAGFTGKNKERACRKVIADLRRENWLTTEPRYRQDGGRTSNGYQLNTSKLLDIYRDYLDQKKSRKMIRKGDAKVHDNHAAKLEIDDYVRLAVKHKKYSSVNDDPDAFQAKIKRRLASQGDLSAIDRKQLYRWRESEKKKLLESATRKQPELQNKGITDSELKKGRSQIRKIMKQIAGENNDLH